MNPSWQSVAVLAILLATMAAYALFSGADFGGGIWDLLAGGTDRGARPREAIDRSVTPVWEGNQTWIVLGLVLLWTAFPQAFAACMTALFVPLCLSLLGIFFRGIGFAFRHEARRLRSQQLNGVLFAASSFLAPFFLGACVGAVATGKITTHPQGNQPQAWLAATPLLTGALFVAACAYIGAVYLVGDTSGRGQPDLVRYFSRRAMASGAVTGLLAAANLAVLHESAPRLFHRLTGPALPLVVLSVAGGLAAMVLLVLHRHWLLRMAAATAVAAVIAAWGVAQYPWLLPGSLTLAAGSAPPASLTSELVVAGMAAVFVVPPFVYLYWLQQHGRLEAGDASAELQLAATAENRDDRFDGGGPSGVLAAAVTAVGLVAVVGAAVRRARQRSA